MAAPGSPLLWPGLCPALQLRPPRHTSHRNGRCGPSAAPRACRFPSVLRSLPGSGSCFTASVLPAIENPGGRFLLLHPPFQRHDGLCHLPDCRARFGISLGQSDGCHSVRKLIAAHPLKTGPSSKARPCRRQSSRFRPPAACTGISYERIRQYERKKPGFPATHPKSQPVCSSSSR